MNFRFSPGNIVGAVGIFIAVAGGLVLFRRIAYGALESIPGEATSMEQFILGLPMWMPIVVLIVGLIIGTVGYIMQSEAADEHWLEMKDYADQHEWMHDDPPRWLFESRTFPVDNETKFEVSGAWTGQFRGHWAASVLVETMAGARGAESLSTFQVVGMPFNDDMPRVQVMPIDLVEKAHMMVGSTEIHFESSDFNGAWRVRGDNAKRVHDIIHQRTMERLLKADARDVPVIIDGGAIWTWRAEPVSGEEFERLLHVLTDVATGIPPFVYQDLNVELLPFSSGDVHKDWVRSRRQAGIAVKDEADTLTPQE